MKKKNIKNILVLNPAEADILLVNALGEKSKFELYLFEEESKNDIEFHEKITILEHVNNQEFDVVLAHVDDLKNPEYQNLFSHAGIGIVLGYSPIPFSSLIDFEEYDFRSSLIGGRIVCDSENVNMLELVNLPSTGHGTLDRLISWSQEIGVAISLLQYDIPGGATERIRVPLESEAWKMLREGVVSPQALNLLSKEGFGMTSGVLDMVKANDPTYRGKIARQVYVTSMNDGRFRPEYDQFPPAIGNIWDQLTDSSETIAAKNGDTIPEKILVIGTPHIVDLWCDKLYRQTKTTVMPKGIKLWDMGGFSKELQSEINNSGPYDLILEVLIAPTEERQRLLEQLIGTVKENTQFWVHTLNTPATVTVQVIPEQLCAVGFSGIPGINDSLYCELNKPKNSSHSEFTKAVNTAIALGFKPIEVADEPGSVIPRLLATLVNATSFLAREGAVTSEVEADRIAAKALGVNSGPLALADYFGLDTIEAVLIGLYAFNGQDRYRISPLITMRIESGALGNITDKGYYRV